MLHKFVISNIIFTVFKKELKNKLNIKDEIFPFALTMLSRSKLVVCGVKGVSKVDATELVFRLHSGTLKVSGEELKIKEIGGGEVYVFGNIKGVQFE